MREVYAATPQRSPLVTAGIAAELTDRSPHAVDHAIVLRVELGLLEEVGGRHRYEARGVFQLITDIERALASPAADTRHARPNRPVPARRS